MDHLDENDAIGLLLEPHSATAVSARAHLHDCEACRELVATVAKVVVDDESEGAPGWTAVTLRPGTRIGALRVIEPIGRGAMGTVYLAEDERLHRRVALKMLAADRSDAAALRRVRGEARSMARLRHPNVVEVLDVGTSPHGPFVAMQYVEGHDLRTWLAGGPRLVDAILERLLQAGRGLAAAHAAGIVHRDFKPANVLVGLDGRVRVADFGLAILRRDSEDVDTHSRLEALQTATSDRSTTRRSAIVGTPAYMAPEQLRGGAVGPAADQFAFCVTAYEALAGHRPFREDTLVARLEAIDGGRIEPPARPIARRVLAALRRGLRADPSQRHVDMTALLSALSTPRSSRSGWIAAAIAVASLGLVLGLFVEDPVRVATKPAPPRAADPALAAKLSELRTTYLRAEAEKDPDRMRALRPDVIAAIDEAAAIGDVEAHADFLHMAGVMDSDRGDFASAARLFEQSYLAAHGAGIDDVAFDAALDRSLISGSFRGDPDDAWRWARHARAVLAGRPDDNERTVALLVREGSLHLSESDLEAADTALGQAQARVTDAIPGHVRIALFCDLGQLRAMQGDRAACREAFATALHHAETSLGPEHPDLLRPLVGIATCEIPDKLYAAAEAHLQRAIAIAQSADAPLPEAMSHGNLGLAYRSMQRPTAALAELARADTLLREVYGDEHLEIGRSAGNLADAYFVVGRFEDAAASAQESIRVLGAQPHDQGSLLYNARLALANADLELGATQMVARLQALVDEAPTATYRKEATIGLLQALLSEGRAAEGVAIAGVVYADPEVQIPAMSRHRWLEGRLMYALALRATGERAASREALARAAEEAVEIEGDDPRGIVGRIAAARGG